MPSTARAPQEGHPLFADPDLLDRILNAMYDKIHKVLHWSNPGRRSGIGHLLGAGSRERILPGGTSADDILLEAFEALLRYPPERVESWRGLAVKIAGNKAIQALRTSGKGLRGTDHRPELRVVSGDAEHQRFEGDPFQSLFDALPAEWGDPETEFLALESVRALIDLAREILDGRDQQVFFDIHFLGYSRKEVGRKLGLSGARVGQIFKTVMRQLEADPHYPYPTKDDK